jgi:prepilin-type N-terminal cleavage/methylation domain-containing protein
MRLNYGYTLIEVLIALAIFGIVFLGLFATVSVVLSNNIKNLERNEAISILEESLESVRNIDFSKVTDSYLNNGTSNCTDSLSKCQILRQIRNFQKCYGRFYSVSNISSNLKKVKVTVCWKERGKLQEISDETIIGKEE